MDLIVQQRQTVRDFWAANKLSCMGTKSVDELYGRYKQYLVDGDVKETTREGVVKSHPLLPINKYIFRTLIRKMGYKNGMQHDKTKHEV